MNSLLFSMKYFLFNRKKVCTAYICIAITVLLIVLILCISNGVESYLRTKYEAYSDSFLILNTEYYTPEFLGFLRTQSAEEVQVFVGFDDIEHTENGVTVKKIIASNTAENTIVNGAYDVNELTAGRFFNAYEQHRGDRSVIAEAQFARRLLGRETVIGQHITVFGADYRIVGTVQDHTAPEAAVYTGKTEQLSGCLFIPFAVLTEEQLADRAFTYYLQLAPEQTEQAEERIRQELSRRHVTESQFTSSAQIGEEIRSIKQVIRTVLIVLSMFSVLTGILILISTIRLIVMDLQPVLLFLKVQGVPQLQINGCIFIISGIVILAGVLIGILISLPLQTGAQLALHLRVMLQWRDYLFLLILSVLIALVSFPANLRQLNRMKVMHFFRN